MCQGTAGWPQILATAMNVGVCRAVFLTVFRVLAISKRCVQPRKSQPWVHSARCQYSRVSQILLKMQIVPQSFGVKDRRCARPKFAIFINASR